MSGLKNNVPATMRKPLDKAEVILPVLISQHYGGDLNEAIEFIAGALNHQERVTAVKEDGKTDAPTFPVIIDKVEVLERRANGSLLGKKAKIHYHDAKDRDGKKEDIDTGWTEYNGTDSSEFAAWQTSLANTLVDIAKANIGKECYMTKAYVKGVKTKYNDSGKVKFLANLEAAGGKDSKSSNSDRGESRGSSRRSSSEIDADKFADAIEKVKDAKDSQIDAALEDTKLIKAIVSVINVGGGKAAEKVFNEVLDVRGEDAISRTVEDDFFDKSDTSDLLSASAWLVAVTA